jgi:prepilin-type N-terminal cleavage/methylation domain-containing protein
MKKKGFTLIELLVVVAIIGLLATMSIVALNSARARARDAKRVADIKQIQTALELYYNDKGVYPDTITFGGTLASSSIVYMNNVPTAPTPADGTCSTGNTYAYAQTTDSYTLKYCVGAPTGGIPAGSVQTATPGGIY